MQTPGKLLAIQMQKTHTSGSFGCPPDQSTTRRLTAVGAQAPWDRKLGSGVLPCGVPFRRCFRSRRGPRRFSRTRAPGSRRETRCAGRADTDTRQPRAVSTRRGIAPESPGTRRREGTDPDRDCDALQRVPPEPPRRTNSIPAANAARSSRTSRRSAARERCAAKKRSSSRRSSRPRRPSCARRSTRSRSARVTWSRAGTRCARSRTRARSCRSRSATRRPARSPRASSAR